MLVIVGFARGLAVGGSILSGVGPAVRALDRLLKFVKHFVTNELSNFLEVFVRVLLAEGESGGIEMLVDWEGVHIFLSRGT